MKYITTIFISILILNNALHSQTEYKEVKTAQDVLDNFLLSRGGKEVLTKIKTVKFSGTYLNYRQDPAELTRYIGKDFYYQYWGDDEYKITTAYDDKNHTGWEGDGSYKVEFNDELLQDYHLNYINYWGTYLNPSVDGVSFILKGKDTINEIEVYEIDVNVYYAFEKTIYFSTKAYDLIRRVNSKGIEMNYSDFKSTGTQSIPMPYLMYAADTIKINSYEFNPGFDRTLLK